ncbi:MAG: hypothetical protein PHW76_10435 [Alphaproteobacteria bacterium]|nr:hypothetical protein [Alphaproteobacteria bacterium]
MNEFLQELAKETLNVYAIAFVIFWLLVVIFLRKPAFQWLDNQIGQITAELDTARQLRAEAESSLSDVKNKQIQAEKDAKEIIEMAKNQAEAMRKQAASELAATLERQQQLAADRIRLAEMKAVDAIRSKAVSLGMEMARQILFEKISGDNAMRLIEGSIEDAAAFSDSKAKAG